MAVEEKIAVAAAPDAGDPHVPCSVAWWESRSAEELRDIIKRGFAGGPEFPGAVAEVERRARVETRRLREQAAAEAVSRRKRNEVIWGTAASVLAIATLLGFWLAR